RLAREEVAEQPCGVPLDENFRLEIEAGVEAQVLVRRASIAISTPVAASTVRVDAVAEGNVGAIVLGDEAPRVVGEVLSRRARQLLYGLGLKFQVLEVVLVLDEGEAVGRVEVGASPFGAGGAGHDAAPRCGRPAAGREARPAGRIGSGLKIP